MTYTETRTEALSRMLGINVQEMMDRIDYIDAHPDEIDPEERRFVDYSDVQWADEAVVQAPDWTLVPGAFDA